MDVIEAIQAFNNGREQERLQIKYRKMHGNAFVFLRGTCHLFYDRLPSHDLFRSAPLAWSCGDVHLENFGSYKADNRLTYFDINDFEEATLAPVTWDLVRMLSSIELGVRSANFKGPEASGLPATFLEAYASAMSLGKVYWVELDTADGLVKKLLEKVGDRTRARFLDGRTLLENGQRRLRTDGDTGKALKASEEQKEPVRKLMASFAATQQQRDPNFFRVLDVARRIAGTGSLGLERYAVLVEGKGSPEGNYLLDLKQSTASSLLRNLVTEQSDWPSEAHRIVALQRRIQAVSVAFLHPVEMENNDWYVLRELQPIEDGVSLNGTRQTLDEIAQLLRTMGRVVAWAHLRGSGRKGAAVADELMEFANRPDWKEQLLDVAQACSRQVCEDSAAFDVAYENKAFNPDS